jgi:hypothetical protein
VQLRLLTQVVRGANNPISGLLRRLDHGPGNLKRSTRIRLYCG